MSALRALTIESLTVKPDRVVCEFSIAAGFPRKTSPALSKHLATRFPNLPHHSCVNPKGTTFASVMDSTPLPHLLEHLVIDLQAQTSTNATTTFVGTSEWTDEAAGKARVEVSFADDLSVLRAFRDATHILDAALVECEDYSVTER